MTLLHTWHKLGPDRFGAKVETPPASVITATGQFGKGSVEWLNDLRTNRPDAIPVSSTIAAQLRAQTDGILESLAAAKLLAARVDAELSIRFDRNGHACRCRVDGATAEVFYELKTPRAIDPAETFDYECVDWKYDLQAALYGMAAVVAGWPKRQLHFLASSKVEPYHCAVMVLPPDVMRQAEKRVD